MHIRKKNELGVTITEVNAKETHLALILCCDLFMHVLLWDLWVEITVGISHSVWMLRCENKPTST